MNIGVAGPMSLDILDFNFKGKIPEGYPFPFIAYIVNEIVSRGHRVTLYTLSGGLNESVVFKDDKMTICIAPYDPHPGRNLFLKQKAELKKLMKKYPCDVMNVQWSYEFAWAASESGIPFIVTLRDHAFTIFKYKPSYYRLLKLLISGLVLRRAKYLIVNSEYLLSMLTSKNQSKARVISNFFPNELLKEALPEHKSDYILSVANGFDERKNIRTGLEAFAKIVNEFPNLEYKLIGDQMEEGGPAHQYALKNGLQKNVEFLGQRDYQETIDFIKNAKIFLHPSREETFGNVIVESILLKTPVIGGNKSGNVPHLLKNGETGFVVDVDDEFKVAALLKELLLDEKLLTSKIEFAFEFVKNNYSKDHIIDNLIDYIKQVYAVEK